MKLKIVIATLLLIFPISSVFSYINEITTEFNFQKNSYSQEDMDLKISFNKASNDSNEWDLYITVSIHNISEIDKNFSDPKLHYFDNHFQVKPEDKDLAWEYIYWRSSDAELHGFLPQPPHFNDIEIKAGHTYRYEFNITEGYNLKDIETPWILYLYGQYLCYFWERESPGTIVSSPNGYKRSNTVRLMINMENELISGVLYVVPYYWDIAWEEQQDAGVFTVFLGDLKGYSVKKIKKETVLFNGTLKPVDIKIISKHKGMKGKVMRLQFNKKDGMEYLGIKEPGNMKKINISGQLIDGSWFYTEAEMEVKREMKEDKE